MWEKGLCGMATMACRRARNHLSQLGVNIEDSHKQVNDYIFATESSKRVFKLIKYSCVIQVYKNTDFREGGNVQIFFWFFCAKLCIYLACAKIGGILAPRCGKNPHISILSQHWKIEIFWILSSQLNFTDLYIYYETYLVLRTPIFCLFVVNESKCMF